MNRPPFRVLMAAALLVLPACTAPTVDTTELDQPLHRGTGETRVIISPSSGVIKIRDAVAIAKVLRRYRDLDAAEKELVKLAVRRHFDGLVALEARRLEQQFAGERQRISRIPDPALRRREDAALSARLYAQAARNVAEKLEGLQAVPVKTSTSQSVVAFARVVSGDVRVADAAYELDVPLARVGPDTKVAAAGIQGDHSLQQIGGGSRLASVVPGAAVTLK